MTETVQPTDFERENIIQGAAFASNPDSEKVADFASLPQSTKHIFITDMTHADYAALTVPDNRLLIAAFEAMCESGDAVEEPPAMIALGVEEEDGNDYHVRVFAFTSRIGVGTLEPFGAVVFASTSPEEMLLTDIFGGDNPFATMRASLKDETPQA